MTGMEQLIFGYGVFATLLLIAGVIYTIREFREIGRHPEEHTKEQVWARNYKKKPPNDPAQSPIETRADRG